MSYILGLLFTYSRYKHDAIVRVYADDHLIDELYLPDNIPLKTVNYDNMPVNQDIVNVDSGAEFCRVLILPEKLFLFEVQEKYLNSCIRIEVENNHNNYTNGFMTQYSYINFHQVFLIPKCLLKLENLMSLEKRLETKYPDPGQYWPIKPQYKDIIVKSSSNPWPEDFLMYDRGGSFTIDIPLSRKHNIAHIGKLNPGRIWINREVPQILCAFKILNITT